MKTPAILAFGITKLLLNAGHRFATFIRGGGGAMKTLRIAAVVGALLLLLRPASSVAQGFLLWDTSGSGGVQGGTGNWLGTSNWNNIFPGNNVPWIDGVIAVFSATPGTVTLNGAVTASGLTFSVSGYTITGSSVLTLGAASPGITVSDAGEWAVIDAVIGGSSGLVKNGAGDLYLFRANCTYSGPTIINAGRLVLATNPLAHVLPVGTAVTIANVAGAALDLDFANASIGSLSGGGANGGSLILSDPSFLSVGSDNTSTTFAGVITATGIFVKTGTGVLELTNNGNTFTRSISLSSGTLLVSQLSSSGGDPLGGVPSITLGGTLSVPQGGSKQMDFSFSGGTIDVGNPAATLQITGTFTGSSFTKSGPGTLRLSGAGTYRGTTNITGGRLEATTGDPISPYSTVTLADAAGVQLTIGSSTIGGLAGGGSSGGIVVISGGGAGPSIGANNASTTFSGAISGSGGLTKVGTGTLTFTGAGTYSGATNVNAGMLRIGGGNGIPDTSDVTVSALGAATLDLNGSSETIRTLAGGGLVTLGSGTLTVLNPSTTFSGTISGTGGLTKAGTNMFTLNGGNTFTGPTTINAGILRVLGGSALSDLTAVTLANVAGVALDLNGSSETIGALSGGGVSGGDVTLGSGTLTVGANGASTTYGGIISGTGGSLVKTGAGTLTFNFIHTFTGDLAIRQGALSVSAVTNAGTSGLLGAGNTIILGGSGTTGTLLFTSSGADSTNRALSLTGGGGAIDMSDASGALTISGAASGSGGLAKLGPGTLLLSGNNTFGGPTTVSAGRLQLSGGNAIGDGSAVTMADAAGALIELVAGNETIGSLAGGGASGGNVTLGSATLTVGGDGTANYAGAISGGGGLTKTGAGVMTLSGSNGFTGPATIDGGTLRTAGGSALADTAAVTVAAGATLDLNNSSEAIGSLAGSGAVTLGSGTLTAGANNGSTAFTGAISGGGGLTKTGAGTFTLTGPNNFTGPISVTAGTLALENGLGTPGGALDVGAGGAVQARGSVNRAITGAGTIGATGTLFLGDAASASGFAFAGALAADTHLVFLADADAAELGAATALGAGGRLISLNGAVLASGGSVTVGAGVSARIGGAFTNNGTVNGPTLAGQKLTFTDDVNGTGSFTGNVLFSDGFNPGASAAAVSLENFAFDGTTTLGIELGGVIAGSQYDRLNFTGTGTLDGSLNVTFINGFLPQGGNAFTLLQGGTIAGTFDSVNLPALNPGLLWSQANLYTAGEIAVVLDPVFIGRVWDGGGANNDWATDNNWTLDVEPLNNGTADLIFAGNVRLAPSVDTAWNVASLTFDNTAGAFDIVGPQGITVGAGGITNNDAGLQTITAQVTLGTSESFTAALGDLAFADVNIGAHTLTIAGASDVELDDVTGTGTITKTSTGTLDLIGAIGAGGITLNAGAGDTHIGEDQTLAALNIGAGATVTLGAIAPSQATEAVPEPGTGALLASALALLGARRARIRGARASRVLVSASRRNELSDALDGEDVSAFRPVRKVREGGTLSPARLAHSPASTCPVHRRLGETRALPGTTPATQLTAMKALRISAVVGALLLLRPAESGAQVVSLFWDTSASGGVQGGTGDWLGTANWNNVFPGTNVLWSDGMSAAFSATPGFVTVNGAVTANQLIFSVSGYTIIGAATLSMGGATPNISVTNAGHTAFIVPPIGGSVGFNKAGAGALILSGTAASIYTGLATVTDGALHLAKTGVNAITGNLTIGDGVGAATSAIVVQDSNQIADTATVRIEQDGFWNLANCSETIGALVMGESSVATGTGSLTVNGNVSTFYPGMDGDYPPAIISGLLNLGGTRTFTIASNTEMIVSAAISNGGVTKIGSGRMQFNNINSFTGPVAINGGVIEIQTVGNNGVNGYLGAGSSLSFDGGALAVTSAANSATDRTVTLNAGGGTINVSDAGATVTMTGAFTGAGGLTKTGPGTLTLGGALPNDHAGTTTAADGTLILNKPASVNAIVGNLAIGDGSGAAASAIVVQGEDEQIPDTATVATAADGFWNIGSREETVAALAMTAGSIVTGSTGALTVNGNVTTNANAVSGSISGKLNLGGVTRTFDIAEGAAALDLDISAALSNGAGGLTKLGDGTLRLSGANAFSGPVMVNAGTLIASNGSAIGDSSDVTVANVAGATLSIDGDETIGSLAGGGSVVVGAASTLDVGGGSATIFSGSISGAGGLTRSGAGMLTLSSAPAYTGNTLITAGTLALNNGIASAAGSLTVNAPGTLQARSTVNRAIAGEGTITATGTLVIGDAGSASGFAFDGTLNVGSSTVTLADADVAQLGIATTLGTGGRLNAPNGSILASGRSVTATAAGAIISTSFTNNGTVNGPTLAGQSLTFLGDVNGTGNYTGNVLISAGFSPGASAAAVSLENFTFTASTTLSLELGGVLAGSEYDRLNFTGTGLLDGSLNVSLIGGFHPQGGDAFTLLQGGTLAGTFDSVNLPALSPGLLWNQANLYTAGEIAVVLDPVFIGRVWDGGGANNDWATDNNWTLDVEPLNNGTADLIFAGNVRLAPSVDAAWNLASITFDNTAGAFDIVGPQGITVGAGGITNDGTDLQTITAQVTLGTSQSFTAAAGDLAFTNVAIGANTLTVAGANDMELDDVTGTGTITKTSTGTLDLIGAIGAGGITLNAGAGDTHIGEDQTLAALHIGAGATVTLGAIAPSQAIDAVPEPGSLVLLAFGALGLLRRR